MLEKIRREVYKDRLLYALSAPFLLFILVLTSFWLRAPNPDGFMIAIFVIFLVLLVGDLVLLIWASGADL